MSNLQTLNAALRAAYIEALPNLKTAFEGRPEPTASEKEYRARFRNYPADLAVNTLGSGGTDRVTGFLQVDILGPDGDGTTRLLEYAGRLLARFKNGPLTTNEPIHVRIKRSQLTPVRVEPSGIHIVTTLSIYWETEFAR